MPREHTGKSQTHAALVDPTDRDPGSAVDIRVLELLTARLCHELSGPLAAINNGIELLVEEGSALGSSAVASFARDAVVLVSDSARRAGSRLQFYRFAYGSIKAGTNGGPPPHELVRGFFEASRILCDFGEGMRALPAAWQKLACNLLPIGADALHRGGHLSLTNTPFGLDAFGEGANLSPETQAALMLETPIADLTARTIQAYYAGLLAKRLDCGMQVTTAPGRVRLSVVKAAG
jgi:histidine phosphotransferase ChpT